MLQHPPITEDPELLVIVVTFNSAQHLPDLIRSLPPALVGVDRWQLIVVDNDSHDGTPDLVVDLMSTAKVIRMGTNAGYAAAINAGMRFGNTSGPILVLNPDVRLGPGCARALLDAQAVEYVGITVPRLLSQGGETSHSLRFEPSVGRAWAEALIGGRRASDRGHSEVISDPARYEIAGPVDWATGAVMAVSATCRAAIGDWDETFFLYSEEVDYCRRARDAGFTVHYVPGAAAEHKSGEYGTNIHLWRILMLSRVSYFRKHHGPAQALLFRTGLAAGELLRSFRSPAHRAGLRAVVLGGRRRLEDSAVTSIPGRPGSPEGESTGRPVQRDGYIWFAAQDWWYHNQAHSDFQLMKEIARSQPVLVVNSLGLRVPRKGTSSDPLRRVLRKLRSTAKLVRRPVPEIPGFHVMTPVLLPFYGDNFGARLNARAVRAQVRLAGYLVGVGRRPVIGVTIPTAWPVVEKMRRAALLFNRSDLHSAFPEADTGWILSLESNLLERSDRVLYVSHALMRLDAEMVGERGFFLDHGVDLDLFSSDGDSGLDAEMVAIERPRVGFFGGLDDYVVDLPLLRLTAAELTDCQFVLIGDATCDISELTALPNVHWLGYRPYATIPSFGRGFDVALMPWLDNDWIRYANPIKLKEYLALGLPVVSTEYPEVEDYRRVVSVATDRSDFPALVRQALAEPGDPALRRAAVLTFSWSARARALSDVADAAALEGRCAG